MKKCPYCGHRNDDNATGCAKCKAGFPREETKTEPEPRKGSARNHKRSE